MDTTICVRFSRWVFGNLLSSIHLEDLEFFAGANIILVNSSIQALQAIAAFSSESVFNSCRGDHRKQWQNNREGMVVSDLVQRQIGCEEPR